MDQTHKLLFPIGTPVKLLNGVDPVALTGATGIVRGHDYPQPNWVLIELDDPIKHPLQSLMTGGAAVYATDKLQCLARRSDEEGTD